MGDPKTESIAIKQPTNTREIKVQTKNKTPFTVEVNPAIRRLELLNQRLKNEGSSPKDDFQALHLGDYAELLATIIKANPDDRVKIVKSHLKEEEKSLVKIFGENTSDEIVAKLKEAPDPRCHVASTNITETLTHLSVLYELLDVSSQQYLPTLDKIQKGVFDYLKASQNTISSKLARSMVKGEYQTSRSQLEGISHTQITNFDRDIVNKLLQRLQAKYPNQPGGIGAIGRPGEGMPVEIAFEEWDNLFYLTKAAAERFQEITRQNGSFIYFRNLYNELRVKSPKIFTMKTMYGTFVVEDASLNGCEKRTDKSGDFIAVSSEIFQLFNIMIDINNLNDSVVDAYNKPLSTSEHRGNAHNAFGVSARRFAIRIENLVFFLENK